MQLAYDNIFDCPIINYQRAIESEDLKYLLKVYDKSFTGDLSGILESLESQIIDEFGLDEKRMLIFHKQKQLIKLTNLWIITEDDSYLTKIKLAEIELNRLLGHIETDSDIKKIHARNHRALTKHYGRDSKKLSMFDYYNDMKDLLEEIENAKLEKHA
jgi:hypothetical protein